MVAVLSPSRPVPFDRPRPRLTLLVPSDRASGRSSGDGDDRPMEDPEVAMVPGRGLILGGHRDGAGPDLPSAAGRAGATRRRMHMAAVYRRRRLAVVGSSLLVVVAAWSAVQALTGTAGAVGSGTSTELRDASTIAAKVWVVRPGDTLWSIALASGAKGDIRPLVDKLSAQVDGRSLQVGEQIALP